MEENHGNDTLSKSKLLRMVELGGGQGNPDGECAAHAAGGNQEKWTTAKTVDHQSPEPSLKHVNHQDKSVEHVLVVWAVDAQIFQDVVQVVCSQTGARELRENTAAETDENTVAVAA